MRLSSGMLLAVAAVLGGLSPAAVRAEVVLVEDGEPRAVLVLPTDAHEDEKLAAGEMRRYVERMSGAALPGRENTVAVRIINDRVNELRTGGITVPVMFWSPKPGAGN
jgi:hypothetical protein